MRLLACCRRILIIQKILRLSRKTSPPYFSKTESQPMYTPITPHQFYFICFYCLLYKIPHLSFKPKLFTQHTKIILTKQICFLLQCGLFYASDSTRPISIKSETSTVARLSILQTNSALCPAFLSNFHLFTAVTWNGCEILFWPGIPEFLLDGKLLGHHPCLGVDG